MDKAKVQQLRVAIESALRGVEETYGVNVELGRARYNNQSARFAFNVIDNRTGENGQIVQVSGYEVDFQRNCWKWGLESTDIGRQFFHNGKRFTLIGSKASRYRYPIQARRGDGREFKFTVDAIKGHLI